ncbi:MAG: calcium-binding protein, partial [Planctomycetota bacterium]
DSTHTVEVANVAPTPSIAGPTTALEGDPVSLTGWATDPAGANDTITLDWTVLKNGAPFASGPGPDITFTPDDDATYEVTLTASDEDGGSADTTHAVEVANVAPRLVGVAVTPEVDENGLVTLSGTIYDDGLADTFTLIVNWGDGGPVETVDYAAGTTAFSRTHRYLDDDPTATPQDLQLIQVTLADDDGGQDSTSVDTLVRNVAPVIESFTCSVSGTIGSQQVDLTGDFSDIGPNDTHTVMIDWGDGNVEPGTITQGAGVGSLAASHSYAAAGVYTISATLTDDDTGQAPATATVAIAGVSLHDGVLEIIGTDGDDHVTVNQTRKGQVKVHACFLGKGRSKLSFDRVDVDRITMLLGDGDDKAEILEEVDLLAIIDGGAGNDHLQAGGGPSVLMGAEGDDRLIGGNGRNVLIGGIGRDKIIGGDSDDILIGGWTTHDVVDDALTADFDVPLLAILDEWTSTNDYATRVANLTNGGGANGDVLLAVGTTVFDDGEVDVLKAGPGMNWLIP